MLDAVPVKVVVIVLLLDSGVVRTSGAECKGNYTAEICSYLCDQLPSLPEECKSCFNCDSINSHSRSSYSSMCHDVEGRPRTLYETWPDDPNHPCQILTCTPHGIHTELLNETCALPQEGVRCSRYRAPGQCCYNYTCSQPAGSSLLLPCTDETGRYDHGSSWTDDVLYPCRLYKCFNGTRVLLTDLEPHCSTQPTDALACTMRRVEGQCCSSYNCTYATRLCIPLLSDRVYRHGAVWHDDDQRPCVQYLCQNGEIVVVSNRTCELESEAENCRQLPRVDGQCCPETVCHCVHNGTIYQDEEEFVDDADHPCRKYKCVYGDVKLIDREECPTLSCSRTQWPLGQCCRICDGCQHNGQSYEFGEVFFEDPIRPCVLLECLSNTSVTVVAETSCEDPPSPQCTPIFIDGQCCPRYDCPQDAAVCVFGDRNFTVGEIFFDDPSRPCAVYLCVATNVTQLLNSTECDPAPHPSCQPWFIDGICCPNWDCPPGNCLFNGREYDHGVVWPEDIDRPCLWLGCNNSQVYEHSGHPPCPSPPAAHCISRLVQGQCCPNYDCRNVTCLYKGVDYPLGTIFNDDNLHPCKTFNCTKEGPVKIEDLSTQCPPLNPPNCTQIRRPGECCKECDTSAVVEECVDSLGNTHQDGTIFLYDEDACILVECDNGTIQLLLNRSDNCSPPPSNPNCTINPDSEDKCCPDYICPPCRYNGVEYPPGVKFWDDPDRQCRRFMCMPDGSVVTVLDNLPCSTVRAGCVAQYIQPQCCHYKYTCMFDPQHNLIPMT